ncbi:hypothetical protein CsatB_025638 [Cannabis sativa]
MELCSIRLGVETLHHLLQPNSNSKPNPKPIFITTCHVHQTRHLSISATSAGAGAGTALEKAGDGGKRVVELVGAFNQLTHRMGSTTSSSILFKALKLSIPLLHALPLAPDGRSPLSKALSVALLLADLHMDAEVIFTCTISITHVRNRIGTGTAHLLHESLRVNNLPSTFKDINALDEGDASAIRKFCLTYYDIRALILELALKLDTMRNLDYLPRYHQQLISLQTRRKHDRGLEMETWHDLSQWTDAEVCLSKSQAYYIYEANGLHRNALNSFRKALDVTACIVRLLGGHPLPVVKSFLMDALRIDRANHYAWYNLGASPLKAAECFEAAALLERRHL